MEKIKKLDLNDGLDHIQKQLLKQELPFSEHATNIAIITALRAEITKDKKPEIVPAPQDVPVPVAQGE